MTSILPPFPRFIMTVFEPLSLIAGAVVTFISPEKFVSDQIPLSDIDIITPNTAMIAYQLGNIYALLAMLEIAVLYTTTEAKVVRNYVICLWLADIGHVGTTCWMMPYAKLVDVGNWNPMAYGNIAVTIALFLTRSAYLMGLFGPDRQPTALVGKKTT